MLKYIKNINSYSAYGLWEITEPFEELAVHFDSSKLAVIQNHHPKKQLEFLATRILLKSLCEHFSITYQGVTKDEFGKPFLNDSSFHISVSHSFPLVVCSIHKSAPCGIDIEKPRAQIERIKHKFLSNTELETVGTDTKKMCLIWSAKEALYKLYGRKNLLFIENLQVTFKDKKRINGKVVLEGSTSNYELQYEDINEYVVVYSI